MVDVLRLAATECGYDDLLADGTLAVWATNLSGHGVNVLGDLSESSARDVLRKSGVRNLKLCQTILQQAFPIDEAPVDRAAADTQYEFWSALSERLNAMRAAGEWADMIPILLETLERAEAESGLHPYYVPQLLQELAQCYWHTDQSTKCLEANATAMSLYAEGKNTHKWMEAMLFQGHVHRGLGQDVTAAEAYGMVLRWATAPEANESPIVATTKLDLKLAARAELGAIKIRSGALKEAEGLLSVNLVEASKCNAFGPTLRTLRLLVECFDGLGDHRRCLAVAERAIAWCQKHANEDEAQTLIPLAHHYTALLKDTAGAP